MKSFKCPPAGYTIDLGVARFQAMVLMFLMSISLATQHGTRTVIALLVFLDLLPRALGKPHFSPSGIVGKKFLKSLGFHPRRVDAAPKRFTARVTTLFALAIAALSIADQTVPALVTTGIVFVGSTLEALFDISVGCKVHEAWWSIFGKPRSPDQF